MSKKTNHIYNIGEIVNDLLILDSLYREGLKYYKYKCLKDGYIGEIYQGNLQKGKGCPCCSNKIVIKGINDIATTHPWMVKYFVNKEESFLYSYGSTKKVDTICPCCKNRQTKEILKISYNGYICNICGDGVSVPEKIFCSILNQSKEEFITQYSPKWITPKRYDFYLPNKNIIIEVHGRQHYSQRGVSHRTLEEEKENDLIKEKLAKEKLKCGYIVIDCRNSNIDYVRSSIENSNLTDIIDISKIDWKICLEFSCKNLIKEVCELWEKHKDISFIVKETKISKPTILSYLKKGETLGWCSYSATENKSLSSRRNGLKNGKRVKIIGEDVIFNSCSHLSQKSEELYGVFLDSKSISRACSTKRLYKGFLFEYIFEEE